MRCYWVRNVSALAFANRFFSTGSAGNGAKGSAPSSAESTMTLGIDPKKLDLQLNFTSMNFDAMAEATSSAVEKERRALGKNLQMSKNIPEAAVKTALETAKQREAVDGSSGNVRGIINAESIHSSQNPSVAYGKVRSENPTFRYSLLDALNDCAETSNWAKAYHLFDSAVQKALDSVPCTPSSGFCHNSLDVSSGNSTNLRFSVLHSITATSPPPSATIVSPAHHLIGIMRWNGIHFLVLLRTLIQHQRWKEIEKVWDILGKIGFLKYKIDGKFANSMISLIRRSMGEGRDNENLVTPSDESESACLKDSRIELTVSAKAVARRIILEIESSVQAKDLKLNRNNLATTQKARIAEALKRSEEEDFFGDVAELTSETEKADLGESGPKVVAGDFNGLLRTATSHKATMQILAVMDSLNIERTGTTYANIIASLQNPLYLVENATDDELQTNYWTDGSKEGTKLSPEEILRSKEKYEYYKRKRVTASLDWFEKCEPTKRNSFLFNELLYVLRGKEYREAFARILTLYRGNTVFSAAAVVPSGDTVEESIFPPQWKVQPDAKTYEALIFRARYLHQWKGMWELYEEMKAEGIQGTSKTYQLLIAEVKVHAPLRFRNDRDEIARLTIDLYKEMRRFKKDAKNLDEHVGIINAWAMKSRK